MKDKLHKWTDREIAKLEYKLRHHYATARKSLSRDFQSFLDEIAPDINKSLAILNNAKKSGDKEKIKKATEIHDNLMREKTIMSDKYNRMVKIMSERLANVNKDALDIVNGKMPLIYSKNYNYMGEDLNTGIKGLKGTLSFDIVDERTIKNLIERGDKSMLPLNKNLNVAKDKRWNTKAINTQMTQSIMSGESLEKTAKRLNTIMNGNFKAAVKNARTMSTYAQNKGRVDALNDIQKDNDDIVCTKEWLATGDNHTRESHLEISGEEVLANEPFSNGLMEPGDPEGDPAEVYNCRCTILRHIYTREEWENG